MSENTAELHTEEPPTPTHAKLIDHIGTAIFAIRWGLVPMYLLLWVPIVSYVLWFAQEVFSFWVALYDDPPKIIPEGFKAHFHPHLLLHNGESFIMWALGLIDASMVANLVVMITVGGYSTFVKEFDLNALKGKPRWMNNLDSNTLKIKMAVSLIGVTAISILKTTKKYSETFAEMAQNTALWDSHKVLAMETDIGMQIVVHVIFMLTALVFTWNAKLLHGHKAAPGQHDTHSH